MLIASLMLLAGAEPNVEGILNLGYPIYICKILGAAKLLGGIAILQNRFPIIKEWAYAGYIFNLLAAAASHAFSGDGFGQIITPLIIVGFVFASYWKWKNSNTFQTNYSMIVEDQLA
jgi:hypothetical protein